MAGGTLIKLVLVALVCSSPVHASRRLQFFFPFGVTFTPPHSGPSAPAEGFPSWKCSFFGKFGIVPHFCQAPAPPVPSPSPEPVPSPSPEPESPSPAPPTDESPSPAPPTEESPSPAPPAEESPSPAPPAEESPSPAPPAEESPSPAPPAEESPSPAPPAEESPSPAPPAEESPSPAPPVEESPSPAPPVEESPSPAPPAEESPSPVPPTPASPSPVPTPPASPSPIPTPPASPSPVPPRPSPSPVPAPTEVRIDPQGGSFSPTVAYERVCPPGTRVVSINGRGGDVLDAIGALICSNGIALPPVGGSGGSPVGHTAGPGGYLGIDVRAGTLLDAVTLVPASGASVTFGGGRGGGTAKPSLRCPANFRVAGIFGRQTPSNVITIGLVCRG